MNSSQWKKSLQWKGKIHCIINVSLVIAIFVPKNLDVLKKIYLFLWHSLKESKNFQFLANFQLEKSLHRSEKKVQWISQYTYNEMSTSQLLMIKDDLMLSLSWYILVSMWGVCKYNYNSICYNTLRRMKLQSLACICLDLDCKGLSIS